MKRKFFIYLFLLILAAFLAIIQFSLISAWPFPWYNLNLIIITIIFSFLILNKNQIWFLAISSGWFLDILNFNPFGVRLLSLFFTAVISHLILKNWLTNRSLYSFLLLTIIFVIIEVLSYNILLIIFSWLGFSQKLFLFANYFWRDLIATIIISLVLVALLFNLLALVGRQLKPFFLKKS